MSTPITWQNINAPDLTAAGRPLEAAQRSFTSAFDQLGSILSQRERMNEQNWQNTKTNNTNAFLDRLASYRTPEELAAAQQSGALAQFRQSLGPIDSAAIRGADEQRLVNLRTNTRQAGEFQDWSTDRAQAGDVEKAKQMIADKNFAGAREFLKGVDLRQESALWSGLTAAERAKVLEGQQDTRFSNDQTRFGWEGQMQPLELAAKRANTAQSYQSIAESKARIAHMGDEAAERRNSRTAAEMSSLSAALGKLRNNTIDTQEGMESVAKFIRGNYKDEAVQKNLLTRANAIATKGVQTKDGASIPIRVDAMLKAIGATEDTRWNGTKWLNDSDQGDYVQENLIKILSDKGYIEQTKAQNQDRETLRARMQHLQRLSEGSSSR